MHPSVTQSVEVALQILFYFSVLNWHVASMFRTAVSREKIKSRKNTEAQTHIKKFQNSPWIKLSIV